MASKRIIVPMDFSENSDTALMYASGLAYTLKAEVYAFYVIQDKIDNGSDHKDYDNVKFIEFRNYKRDIPSEIQEMISQMEPEIVIMSRLLMNEKDAFFISDIAKAVVRSSKFPILLIPQDIKFAEIKKVLLAFNMHENYMQLSCGLIHIVSLVRPEIILYVYSDPENPVNENFEISEVIKELKIASEYLNIHAYKENGKEVNLALESFITGNRIDILALEVDRKSFYQLMSQNPNNEMSCCLHVPILCFHPC